MHQKPEKDSLAMDRHRSNPVRRSDAPKRMQRGISSCRSMGSSESAAFGVPGFFSDRRFRNTEVGLTNHPRIDDKSPTW